MSTIGNFKDSYKQLNTAQRQAVDTLDGPVLVVAGPGTGKTQLLSMRVANILRKTDVDPDNILCLTFTNKAAVNMRQRIIELTGGEASGVMVKTFHSFAAELMNIYPNYFWNGAKLSTAPDATQAEIIQSILAKLPLDNPLALRFAGNFTAGKDVKNALKHVKEAGLTPDKLRALVKANIAYIDSVELQLIEILGKPLSVKHLAELRSTIDKLNDQGIGDNLQPLQDLGLTIKSSLDFALAQDEGTNKTKNTGKWKQRWVQNIEGKRGMHKERERNLWWLHLADVYQDYRDSLHARGYYDYADMLVEVINQLQKNPSMLADAQERFLYVLIDEFQDTNAAQLQLANLIADHPASNGRPNLMAVGDDDQSIYKFNGAELNNMLSFRSSYPQTTLIVLTDNYRSSQEILDTSKIIIDQVNDRLSTRVPEIQKTLNAQNAPKHKGVIEHRSYATEEQELSSLADSIAHLHQEATSESSSNHIAVLARNHASLRRLASLLDARNIPISYEQQNNILEQPVILTIYQIASALEAIKQGDAQRVDIELSKIVRHPMWRISPETLWSLALSSRQKTNWLDVMRKSSDTKIQDIANWLMWLSGLSDHQPLSIMLEYIIGLRPGESLTSPLKQYYLAHTRIDTDYLAGLSALRILQSLANDFAKGQQVTLKDFVEFLKTSMDSGEVIADESVFVSGDNAVQLLTVHKSKGLEFDTVFVMNAIDNSWKPSPGGRKYPANLPLQPVGDDLDDYTRLMYVAATRAKRSLIATSHRQDIVGKEVLATPLIHQAMPSNIIDFAETDDPQTLLENHLTWPHLNIADEKKNLQDQLLAFSLSASSLLDFLDLSKGGPEYFFERHLLRLPEASTTSAAFGTAIHSALEYAQILTNGTGLNLNKVTEHYQTILQNQFLPSQETKRYIEHGKVLLTKLFNSDTFWMSKGGLPEQNIQDVLVGDNNVNAKIKGTIDRININNDQLIIIDYKTGKPLASFVTKDQTKIIKAWRYRMQLIFYALLIKKSSRFKSKNVTGQIWYVEASSPKELVREYSPSQEEVDELEHLITIIWPKITELNLPDTTNYSSDYTGIQTFIQDLISGKI
ncbi:ATP-dependent helicase [Candidatus Saccharibacteria bacterium]|nr:ATP-dependent helicase [Candidatus Saccharibacteria bacterium]